jgi:hypothetical protein
MKNRTLGLHHWDGYGCGGLGLLSAFALFLTFASFGGHYVSWAKYVIHNPININMKTNFENKLNICYPRMRSPCSFSRRVAWQRIRETVKQNTGYVIVGVQFCKKKGRQKGYILDENWGTSSACVGASNWWPMGATHGKTKMSADKSHKTGNRRVNNKKPGGK